MDYNFTNDESNRLKSLEARIDMNKVRRMIKVFYCNHYYSVFPEVIAEFDKASVEIVLFDELANTAVVEVKTSFLNVETFTVNLDTGEISDSYGNILLENVSCRRLYFWDDIVNNGTQFVALQQFFEEWALELAIMNNDRNAMSYHLYYVTEYNAEYITIIFNLNGENYEGTYNIKEQTLSYFKGSPQAYHDGEKQHMIDTGFEFEDGFFENAFEGAKEASDTDWDMLDNSYRKRRKSMHKLDAQKDILLRRFEKGLKGLADSFSRMLQQKEKNKDTVFSMRDLQDATYQVAGVMVKGMVYNGYPVRTDEGVISDEEITGMMLVMNLQRLGFKNTMAVVYNFTDSKLRMTENEPADTRNDWYVKIKPLLKTYSTPGLEKAAPNVPTLETINSSQFTITHHKFGNFDSVYIIRRYDDEIYQDWELKNPYTEVFAHHSISSKKGKNIPELEHLRAYAAAEEGIFYVTAGSDKLMYMHRNGKKYALVEVKDIMNMSYKAGVVTYTVFEKVNQTGWNQHMDICGGLSEQWVDIYEVISRTETYNTAKLMNYIREKG